MKRNKLFLTETEVIYLQQIAPNIMTDSIADGSTCSSMSKRQLQTLLNKIEAL